MTSDSPPTVHAEGLWKRRAQLLLILGITLFSVITSSLMFYTGVGIPEDTKNKGVLLSNPVAIGDIAFSDDNGEPWQPAEQPRLFRMVVVVDGNCDKACRNQLYLARQVQTRLAERSDQVQRLLINTGAELSPELRGHVQQEHPELTVLHAPSNELTKRMSAAQNIELSNDGHQVLFLDRDNYLMMAYTPEHAGGEILEDLKFLLKTKM